MLHFAHTLPILGEWPEPKALLERIATAEPGDWLLPMHICKAVGGKPESAIAPMLAVACLQLSIILVDDILDEDIRGEHHRIGVGPASNQALALQSASIEAIMNSTMPATHKLAAIQRLNQTALQTSYGQHLDTHTVANESAYWRLVQHKSSPYFSLAFYLGALAGNGTNEIADHFATLGAIYGEIIQIQDDMSDAMTIPAGPDWLQERLSLPILFARSVDHPDRARFLHLYGSLPDTDALAEMQQILLRCGAISYCIHQLLQRHAQAALLVNSLQLVHEQVVKNLLADVLQPVRNMFSDLGIAEPEGL